MLLMNGVREICVDLDAVHVGHDEKRRIFERRGISLKLRESGIEVFMFSFVLPRETLVPPNVCPTVAAAGFLRAALEAIRFAVRIYVRGRRLSQHPTKVDEMLVRTTTLFERR